MGKSSENSENSKIPDYCFYNSDDDKEENRKKKKNSSTLDMTP